MTGKKAICKKKIVYVLFILSVTLMLTGCGHVKSVKQLVKMAKRAHGACEVVSKEESEECTRVILRDKLQGFEYTMTSSMYDIVIDGSSFGSLPDTYDSFKISLQQYVVNSTKPELDRICEQYGATYEYMNADDVILKFTLDHKKSDSNAALIVEEASAALQEYNEKHRMDGMEVYVEHDEDWLADRLEHEDMINGFEHDYVLSSSGSAVARHMGSAVLPDCVFRNLEAERDAYFLEMALMTDRRSQFVRKEKKTLKDLGLIVEDVGAEYGRPEPKDGNYEVTVYYFTAAGQEYYILDVQNSDGSGWYTNYVDEYAENKERMLNILKYL